MSVVVFPFKDEDQAVVTANLAIAAGHDRVREVWAVAGNDEPGMDHLRRMAGDIATTTRTPVSIFSQERLGVFRPGKGDGMNTAIKRAADRGFDRLHFYDADITNFDESWIDGAEAAADRGFGVVRHRFPRAATDAMITWMVTRPGLALLFPHTVLPRLGQPLGGELLLRGEVIESLASDPFVIARSDWGIDTILTHATSTLGVGIYEHNAPDGKRHALYGSLTDIRDMVLECLDAISSLQRRPAPVSVFEADPPSPVPDDLKQTVAYDLESTRHAISTLPDAEEKALLDDLRIDPSTPVEMDAETWARVLPALLDRFRLDDDAWRSAVFRLWVERVIHYTIHQVPHGYDAAMAHLEQTIIDFEETF